MTKNKRLSVINLVIYLAMFVADVVLVGIVKGNVFDVFGAIFGGSDIGVGDVASAAVMILAMVMLIICGVTTVANVILKILQASFDKWGFSVASVVLDSLTVLWMGIITVSYLSGADAHIGLMSLFLLLLSVVALTLECIVITKRGNT